MMKRSIGLTSLMTGTALCCLLASAAAAHAQAAPPADADSGDIIVTARKSAENILDTPISISALTGEDIRERGIVSLIDVANYTPGMNVVNNGSSRNDRATQQIILRGFTPPSALAQTASVFIDGVPVASALAVNSVTNPSRIEVLKGPQSAYFGRQTFAGAVNVITREPTPDWNAELSGMIGTRGNYDVQADVSGPIIEDLVAFRATARGYGRNGSYRNAGAPSERLGDQSTKTGILSVLFTPASTLRIKALGLLTVNDDGPSAQGLIAAYTLTGPTGNVIVAGQSNCRVNNNTRPYFCGVAPALLPTTPSANTIEDSFLKNFLASPTGRLISPKDGVKGYGLHSRYEHLHLVADWEIADAITLTSLTGYNRDRNGVLADTDNYYDTTQPNPGGGVGARPYMDFPFLVEKDVKDFSQEVRAAFRWGGLSGVVGGSYLQSQSRQGNGGGNTGLGTVTFSRVIGKTRNKTYGLFFGLNYKITPSLTLSVDGRYQNDHAYVYAPPSGTTIVADVFGKPGFYPANTLLADKSYKTFSPRVIAQYEFGDTMVYASFARGLSPAAFNTQFFVVPASVQRMAQADGFRLAIEPEKIDNYEIGIKGRLFNNRVRYSVAAYRALWKNQINTVTTQYIATEDGRLYSSLPSRNAGKVRITGIEAEVGADLSDRLTIDLTGAINDTHIEKLFAPTVTTLSGITDFRGKENPLTSKYSASASLQYTVPLPSIEGESFARVDYSFKSGTWSNAANFVRSPNFSMVNLRLGVNKGKAGVEAFVTNLFNTHRYTSITDSTLFTPTFSYALSSALVAGLPELRTVGLRVRYGF